MASDFDQVWGSDISLTAAGRIALVDGTAKGEQRVLRRLLTNPGAYIWHPDYGAGLPRYVGQNLHFNELEAVIRQQLRLESVVARVPVPVIKLRRIVNGVFVAIMYVDAVTNTQANLSFDLTA